MGESNKGEKNMKSKLIGSFLISTLVLLSCASIVSKTQRAITFNSTPDRAEILITDERGLQVFRGQTPTTVTLKTGEAYFHGKEYTVIFTKEGCVEQTIIIRKQLNVWYLGNIIFGGLIGLLIVDPITGAMWTLEPQDVRVTLAQKRSESNDKTITFALLSDIPKDLQEKMIKIK